jgi:hypothetical protein
VLRVLWWVVRPQALKAPWSVRWLAVCWVRWCLTCSKAAMTAATMTATKTAAVGQKCVARVGPAPSTFTMIVAARPVKDHVDRLPFEPREAA